MHVRSLLAAATILGLTGGMARAAENVPAQVTFTEHVAPIIFHNCTSCHRAGEGAPFELASYRDVQKRGKTIQRVVEKRYMPPWHPEPGHGQFKDERRLKDEQVATITRWVETGMAEGDPKLLPKMPAFTEGWQLGKPDLIVTMEKAYPVYAEGRDINRNFTIPLNLTEDKWVTAVEVRPSARSVVHHVLFFYDTTGASLKLEGRDGQPGFLGMAFRRSGSLGGWAVGATPRKLPEGLAWHLPKGSDLVLQTHFHPAGKAEREQTTLGLYFTDKSPTRTMVGLMLPPFFGRLAGLDIPAGKADFAIRDAFTLPVDVELVTVGGHAHYIARTVKADATLPDGTKKPLFSIADWDFNWQGRYEYKEFVKLPKGTKIDAVLNYDNSPDNPRNPNQPPKRIRWGIESTDEMGTVAFMMVPTQEKDAALLAKTVREHALSKAPKLRGLPGLDLLEGVGGRVNPPTKDGKK